MFLVVTALRGADVAQNIGDSCMHGWEVLRILANFCMNYVQICNISSLTVFLVNLQVVSYHTNSTLERIQWDSAVNIVEILVS